MKENTYLDMGKNPYIAFIFTVLLAEMPNKRAVYSLRRVWFGEEVVRKYGASRGKVGESLESGNRSHFASTGWFRWR